MVVSSTDVGMTDQGCKQSRGWKNQEFYLIYINCEMSVRATGREE